ncbi:hypothetical protein [Mycobacteroides salmoniphilum]|uniref:Uncharacterized protein n=1 Tax=Mycobacteroides salmoniphilum TaxID=404941 RepID=A0A4V3HZE0_9MYCO|nr:hypothetical protein [Mycobacteroides salmoniphilum]TDZ93634.1 hypothetical protein CCUG60885_03237 [Mycobacteroides salmoniphilum]TEA09417.1 hypothetical protein CCUG60883_00178 [Mycobacteroides salmoniphilum]
MTGTHPELGPELRALAASILDMLDPALRQAARAPGDGGVPGKCNQLFCPVCALAALVEGEHHPLLATIAEHSLALVMVVRAMLEAEGQGGPDDPDGPDGGPGREYQSPFPPPSPSSQSTGYQPIPVDIDE